MVQQNNLRHSYIKNGFVILKSVYTVEKIRELRDDCIKLSLSESEILNHDFIQELILNENLIKNIKALLDTDQLWYYSDSNIINHIDPFNSKNGFHNDARYEDENIPFINEYPLLRIGIYLENYKKYSGGLKIKEGSHKHFCFNWRSKLENIKRLLKVFTGKTRYDLSSLRLGKSINLELEEGDVVIWNLRTHHCGVSRRLKFFSRMCLHPFIEKLLPKSIFLPTQYEKNRCSVFCTFAKKDMSNANILNYIKFKADKEKINLIEKNSKLKKNLNDKGISLPGFI
ncbi:hypothetical protein OAJ03_02475 [Candidatus Pelagibacter sp.]|nr:hypothetical protein [Candidatus Pelagibacter sp.]